MKRKHVPLSTKLAAALAHALDIPREDQKLMTAEQMLSLVEWDHIVAHAHGGGDHFSNLSPMFRAAHREKTRKIDIPRLAKNKRIMASEAAHRARLAFDRPQPTAATITWVPRKIPSRPFGKNNRKIQSRGFR